MPHIPFFGRSSLFLALAAGLLSCTVQPTTISGKPAGEGQVKTFAVSSPVIGGRGVVSSAHPLATQAGMRIFAQGGNAIDAAIATAATLAVVEPQSSGLGGVGVLIMYDAKSKTIKNLNFRGTVPSLASLDRLDEVTKEIGVLAACIPGAVAGWSDALKQYGSLSLSKVFQPAIEYAESGFPVDQRLSSAIRNNKKIHRFPTSTRIFLPNGEAPEPGDLLVQKDLARTLKKIAAQGPDVFYRGEIAEAIVQFSKEHDGFFTQEDFAKYAPRWEEPISTSYRGYKIHVAPPPAAGPVILELFNILEGFDLNSQDRFSARVIHLYTEAAKLASSDAMKHSADPVFNSVPVSRLISKEYARKQRQRINLTKAAVKVTPGDMTKLEGNTTAFVTADRDGNVVAVIQTILQSFGSGVVFGDSGVVFNNNMRQARSNGPNKIEPGKIFRHPSTPIIVTSEGKPILAVAAAGADTIWQTLSQAVINVLDYGMNIQEAVSAPRMAIVYGYNAVENDLRYIEDYTYGKVAAEDGFFTTEVAKDLNSYGHSIVDVRSLYAGGSGSIGSMQGIQIDPDKSGTLMGAADPRRTGQASAW